jgi:hypothetical protein
MVANLNQYHCCTKVAVNEIEWKSIKQIVGFNMHYTATIIGQISMLSSTYSQQGLVLVQFLEDLLRTY